MKVSLVVLGVLARSAHGLYEEQAGAEDWYVMLFYVLSAVAWCQHAAVLYFSGATLFSLVPSLPPFLYICALPFRLVLLITSKVSKLGFDRLRDQCSCTCADLSRAQ